MKFTILNNNELKGPILSILFLFKLVFIKIRDIKWNLISQFIPNINSFNEENNLIKLYFKTTVKNGR